MYFEGIAGDQNLELIEQIVNQVNSFSSHGSGWINDRDEGLEISSVVFLPTRAGFYLELPDALCAASNLLTNINTKDLDEAGTSTPHLDGGWRKTIFQPSISIKKEL